MPTVRFTESVSKHDLDALFEWAKASYGAENCWKTLYLNGLPLGNLSQEWAERVKTDWRAGCSESSDGIFIKRKNISSFPRKQKSSLFRYFG